MARPARIQYENAFYHVMNRGRGKRWIFHGTRYYEAFLKTLEESHQRFDAKFHAYCLMGNHYHLLVETPLANLDRIMRHINGVYTQRHNRFKRTDGPLFRGRYKAVLIDEDAYLLQVSRYIHRNPLEVQGASKTDLDTHRWSSYPAYVNKAKSPNWLARERTYKTLGAKNRHVGYRNFVQQGNDVRTKEFYGGDFVTGIFGDRSFRQSIHDDQERRVSSWLWKYRYGLVLGIGLVTFLVLFLIASDAEMTINDRLRGATLFSLLFALLACLYISILRAVFERKIRWFFALVLFPPSAVYFFWSERKIKINKVTHTHIGASLEINNIKVPVPVPATYVSHMVVYPNSRPCRTRAWRPGCRIVITNSIINCSCSACQHCIDSKV